MKHTIHSIVTVIIPAVLLALPAFAQNPSLRVAPKDTSILIADSYTLSMRIENAQNLGAFEFEFVLSSAIARIDSVRLGGFLGSTGRIAIPVGPSIDTTGSLTTLRFGGLTFGNAKGPSGGGVLAKVHLTARASGTTNLTLSQALLTDVAGQTLNIAAIVSGKLTVLSGQPDLTLSSVFVSPDSLPAQSACWTLVTVVPREASGDTLPPGQTVSFTTTAGNLPGKIKGHPDGSYSQRLYAPPSPAIAEVTAHVNGVILPMRPQVVFYAPPARRVALDPASRAVAPGDSFTLAVTADSVCDLGSFEVTFAFPTGRVRFQNAEISGFLGSTGRTALSTPVRTSEQADTTKVTVGGFSFGGERGPDGSGDLAFLHFELSGVQPAEISITNAVLTTSEGKALSVAQLSGSTITPLLRIADPIRSVLFAKPDSIPADGFSTATVTVVPVAANGDTLPAGVEINLTATAGRWANAGTPHPNGVFTRTLVADASPGVATIRATVNGVALARSGRVVFFAAPEKFMRIAPSDTTVFLGKSFDMAIWAENVHELGSFEFLLQTPGGLIRIDSIRLGDFLASTGRTVQSIGPDIRENGDSTAARFGAFSFGKSKAPSGKGILAVLRITPLRLGEATLNFGKAILANAAGQNMPGVTSKNARIVIAPSAADPLVTSVFADPDTLIANGATFSQITVVPRDARGDTLPPCQQVEIRIQNGGGSWENDVVCHHDGAYTRILRSPATPGQAQISALVNGVRANQLATIVFLPSLETKLSIDPALTTVLVKNRFDIGIYLENIANLGGFELTLKFLSRIMAFEQARVGALLQNTGRTAVIIDSLYTIGPDTTALRLGVFSFGSQLGASGSGAIAQVAFRALQPGESVLAISGATLVNPAGDRLALDRLQAGTVRVIAGVVDPVLSEVVAQPDSGAADGVFCSTITVVPHDTSGLPLGPGQNVRLSATPPGALAATLVDHNDGAYTQALCATLTAGVSKVTAVVNGVLLTQQPTVKFKSLPTIFAQPAAPFGHAGKTFEIQVGILGASSIEEKIARLQFEIDFTRKDDLVCLLDSLQYGDFFGPIHEVDFFIDAQCSIGKISFETGRRYAGAAKPDSGSLAFLRFKTNRYMPDSSCVQFSLRNISAQDSIGNPIVLLAKNTAICIRGPQVWAGDTNNDGIVSQADWLPVGIYYGQQGPARRHASTAWTGQYATRWQNVPATFADADGNGRIADLDAVVVNRNWGKTWRKTGATSVPAKLLTYDHGGTLLLAPAYAATEKQWAVGVLAKNIDEVQALAFELSYPANFVEFAALKKPAAENWRVFTYDDRAAGTVGVGLCFGKQTGKTLRIDFILKEIARENNLMGRGDFFQIEIRNVTGIDSEGRWIALEGQSWQLENFTTELPSDYRLEQNYPNPFNPATAISYQLPVFGKVHLTIFNVLGQKIRTLVNGEQDPGAYKIDWDGKDDHGMESPSGIYLIKLEAGEVIKNVQAVKLK